MFNIPNLFTAFNMLSGIGAILLVMIGQVQYAPYFIFLGALFDFFDGFLARKLGVTGELGKQLDSFADMITFGLAPGFIMWNMLILGQHLLQQEQWIDSFTFNNHQAMNLYIHHLQNQPLNWSILMPFIGFTIPFFSMFRLAKFNLDTRQSYHFIGLPTPINAIFFTFFPLFLFHEFPGIHESGWLFLVHPILLSALTIVFSILLVSELPLLALKFKGFGWKNNQVKFIFLITSVIFIVMIKILAIPLIMLFYFIFSFIEYLETKK